MLGSRGLWLVLVSLLGGCAAGNHTQTGTQGGAGGDTTTTSTSTTDTTTSSAGGTGGAGATSSTAGGGTGGTTGGGGTGVAATGGTGGATSSSSGGGGVGGSSGAGGTGGGVPTGTALVFANSAAAVLGADYHPGGAWNVSTPGAGSAHRPASALLDASTGVGLYRDPADGSLLFVKWSAGTFSPPLSIGNLTKAAEGPSMVRWSTGAAAVYRGTDAKHYFAQYNGPMSGWSPVAEPILANGIHSFGPSVPAIAIVKGDVVAAYAGDDNNLYDQARIGGVWQGASGHGVGGTLNLTPAIVEIPSGASEALIVYVRKSDAQVMFTLRTAGVWGAPAPVPSALSNDPVALTSAFGDGAVLAFRGTNAILYTCTYRPANNPPWSVPKSFGVTTTAPPALAPGIGGADAEMVFQSAGAASHARFSSDAWSAAVSIGGADINGVALSTFGP